MADVASRSPSPVSDEGDEQVSESTEIEESANAEAGPSSEVKASSSGKGKGKGSGQQNRARVTVVCAECKRLKLKCDRQTPCSNCKSKDKVDKCVYSREAAAKVDSQSLHNRLVTVEVTLWSMAIGLPVVEYESTHPAVVAEIKSRVEKFLANGGVLRSGIDLSRILSQAVDSNGANEGEAAIKGSLLSDLHDLPHGYAHVILESEGVPSDEFCTCDHSLPNSATDSSAKVKEEDGREVLDVNMSQDVVTEPCQPKPLPKVTTLPPVSHYPDNTPHLPPAKVYYPPPQAIQNPAPSFYPDTSDSKKAYIGTSPPATPCTTEQPPLGTSNSATRLGSNLKPSVTSGLIQCLPASAKCLEMLTTAQAILSERPIELGLRSRTAALPQELRDMVPGEMGKAAGWVALTKRVKKCLNRGKEPTRSKSARIVSSTPPPASATANSHISKEVQRARAMAVYGSTDTKGSARSPSPTKNQKEKEKSKTKPPPLVTSTALNPPAPQPDESLPFFAVTCTLLAFGADPSKYQEAGCKESAPYLIALAQQALGLWVDGGEYIPGDRTGEVPDEAVKEARADFLRAYSLMVEFYLNKFNPAPSARCDRFSRHPNQRQLLNLMSKLAAQLASWGYEDGLIPVRDVDGVSTSPNGPAVAKLVPRIAIAEGQEARSRLLWQIVFYDVCIASMFQRDPLLPPTRSAAMALPTLVPDYHAMVTETLESLGAQGEEAGSGSSETPRSAPSSKAVLKDRRGVEEERMRHDRFFLALRARITRLSSTVDKRLAKGYSLEQAAEMAGEVQSLFDDLPSELCWATQHAVKGTSSGLLASGESLQSISDQPSSPAVSTIAKGKGKGRTADGSSKSKSARLSLDQDGGNEVQLTDPSQAQESDISRRRARTLSCELALMGQLLIVRIYSPFAPKTATVPSGSASSTAPEPLLNASKAIIRVAKLMQHPTQPSFAPSALLAMYSLDQLVLDATLLCAQHCFGGTIIKTKDSKSGVQKKDTGREEMMQTLGIGLDLLDVAVSTSSISVSPLEAKVVESLRKQWALKNSSPPAAQSRKRTRGVMEGKPANTPVEPAKKKSPISEERISPSATEEPQIVLVETPVDSTSRDSSARPVGQASGLPPAPPPQPVPLDPATRITAKEAVEKKKGKGPRAAPPAHINMRVRGPGGESVSKRAAKQQASTPLTTNVPRTLRDGKLIYDPDPAPNAPQRPPIALQPPIVQQITPPQPHAQPPEAHPRPQALPQRHTQPSPPTQPYGGYTGHAQGTPYGMAPNKSSPASQYHPTFSGGMAVDEPTLASSYQEPFSGYPPYPPQTTPQDPSYHHRIAYSPHPQRPMPPVQIGTAPDGYFDHQRSGGSGYQNQSTYAPSPGPDVYMKHPVPTSSYSTLAYHHDLPPTSESSIPTWQDQQAAPAHMQHPLPTQPYSDWQPTSVDAHGSWS